MTSFQTKLLRQEKRICNTGTEYNQGYSTVIDVSMNAFFFLFILGRKALM